jgi:uncharacterized protein (DUF2267 family)
MSTTGLVVFDKTQQTTHLWLNELTEAIGSDKQLAWHVLGTVLRAVRDRMPVDLAAHLGAELPLLIRGAYYDQFRPEALPKRARSWDEFLQGISTELSMSRPVDVGAATRAVFDVLSHYVNPDQIGKVREAMPKEVRAVWPDPNAPGMRAGAAE